ncbi:MAG TPA: hypothetical protein VNF49_05425 [Candidatus Binataceae bacterium]|nr:hypothetical protein [Candidatus Binataceae bacterium]
MTPYSSLAAYIAHYAALRAAHHAASRSDNVAGAPTSAANPNDAATLAEMEHAVGELNPADRAALVGDPDTGTHPAISAGAAARHRARAELKLRRILTARGLLTG